VLERLGIDLESRRVIEVWNKVDLLGEDDRQVLANRAERAGVAMVSAATGEGVEPLLARLAELIDDAPPITVFAPVEEGAAVAWLYRHGRVLERAEDDQGGTRVSVRLSPQALGRFEQLFPDTVWRSAAE
jgi:GTP-binding protein HflX